VSAILPTPVRPANLTVPKMTDELFTSLRQYIYDQTGIYFQDNKKYLLEGRLAKRLQVLNLADYEAYFQLIRFGTRKTEELRFFYDAITINETFFFRNEAQFDAFENTLVPSVMATKTGTSKKLRVWSAASSSGEEAHTISMIYLERLRARHAGMDLDVVGTDINSTVLDTARKGIYRDYSVRNMPKMYLDKYFHVDDQRYHVKDEVKKHVRFDFLNLFDQQRMRTMTGFDIIFCCNVLIYFDLKSKIQVVSHLYNALNRGGFLFIGYAESLHGISTAFKLVNFPKTVAYKKE
jgi:chemotaxis protein methyltransferase CheR